MRIFTPIHFPSNIRRLFGWPMVGICLAVGLSVTRGAHQKYFAKHFFTKPCGLVRSRYVALTNRELKKTATVAAAGTPLDKRFKDVRVHCYCASLVRTLFIRHARAKLFSCACIKSKTQQNIELMTFALTWCANIFVECSVTPTFFSADHFLL